MIQISTPIATHANARRLRMRRLAAPAVGLAMGLAMAAATGFDPVGVCLGALAATCMVLAGIVDRQPESDDDYRAA